MSARHNGAVQLDEAFDPNDAAAIAAPDWADQVHAALRGFFASRTGNGHFDANGAHLQQRRARSRLPRRSFSVLPPRIDQGHQLVLGQATLFEHSPDRLAELGDRATNLVLVSIQENVEPDHPTMLAHSDRVGAGEVVRGAIAELPNADVSST